MKKFLILLLALLVLLSGCERPGAQAEETVAEPTETVEPTESEPTESLPLHWVESEGMAWDADGALWEMPLTIPDGMHYTSYLEIDGDLLMWSFDHHIPDTTVVEFCVVELEDGSVIAQRDIPVPGTPTVQVLEDSIYLTDGESGHIEQLNKKLQTIRVWETEPITGNCYMGAGKLYIYEWDGTLSVRDLSTGATESVLPGEPPIDYVTCSGHTAMISYYLPDTGAPAVAALNLLTGEIVEQPIRGDYTLMTYQDGIWLLGAYTGEFNAYTLTVPGEKPVIIEPNGGTLQLIDGQYLLYASEMDTVLRLYNLQGECISACDLSAQPYSYYVMECIWSDTYSGYFCSINCYDGNQRLLFWDIQKGRAGDPLPMAPIPDETESNALLKERAQEIGDRYGITVLVSNDCDTVFDEFTAQIEEDYMAVNAALDILEEALAVYPEGFFRQLRYGSVYGIRIQLVTDLMADGSGRYGDGYIAFAQENWDHYLVVIDIEDSDETTYYHEFSHVIDSYLAWDSGQREDALYSEETWASLNPSWFTGYSYDYSIEHELKDWTSFVDGYSTIRPTEDRARVMEYAMAEYGEWTFEDAEILLNKLEYYSLCIRDAFHTEGWPETLPWEQYLN